MKYMNGNITGEIRQPEDEAQFGYNRDVNTPCLQQGGCLTSRATTKLIGLRIYPDSIVLLDITIFSLIMPVARDRYANLLTLDCVIESLSFLAASSRANIVYTVDELI